MNTFNFVRKLTLESAPAGFGKTTLVRSWLHQLEDEQALSPAPPPPSSPDLPQQQINPFNHTFG